MTGGLERFVPEIVMRDKAPLRGNPKPIPPRKEAVSECYILVKVKAGENFNRRRHEVSALVNTLSILRIKIWAQRGDWSK